MKLNNLKYSTLAILVCVYAAVCVPVENKNSINQLEDRKNQDIDKNPEKHFQNQLQALIKLGCKPKKFKVRTRTLIDSKSPVHNMEHVYPEFVIVQKCDESCFFCEVPDNALGIENGVCKAAVTKSKRFVMKYLTDKDGWKFSHVRAQEDKECECKNK
ncbi:unnamed protein product [Meganyctiphanes norvegica]|uniref:Platelet-derived growth factor (PDGF) family profile domain-containing protein n=1 Tax=Meganyctiphanes norvegica TaxID=48144 RepID=A0AAV2RKX0_MEGNR